MNITLDTTKALGFGDQLCLLSLLSKIPEPVTLWSNNRETYYDRIKHLVKLLKVPIAVKPTVEEGTFAGAWHLKTVCDYHYPNIKHAKDKNYIGLCLYNGVDGWVDNNYDFYRNDEFGVPNNEGNNRSQFPQIKFRPLGFYSKVFELCRRAGFDVITFDAHDDLEFKLEMLTKKCRAVIGYEGGTAHLCHMLRVPYIMFDHQYPYTEGYGVFTPEVIHQSSTLHIVRDDEEFLKLNKKQVHNLIDNLKKGMTNNRLLTGEVYMRFTKGFTSPICFYNRNGEFLHQSKFGPQVSDSALEIITKYFFKSNQSAVNFGLW